jgi:hypothetical protein|tara:strand:- start:2048 stop:2377 length:330 start_codon:yes stop_codon:yes gene_type:complete
MSLEETMFTYELAPVDNFYGSVPLGDYLNEIKFLDRQFYDKELIYRLVSRMETIPLWEGDVTDGVYVFSLPGPNGDLSLSIGIVWKQENDGATFVVSEIELPWLKECEV